MNRTRRPIIEKNRELLKLRELVQNKKVHLAMDWDADGISSGALIYHLIKDIAEIHYSCSREQEIRERADIYIFIDRNPTANISPEKTILIDHHKRVKKKYILHIFAEMQSTSLLIFETFLPKTRDPYFIFLTLLGYFGDDGSRENIPTHLLKIAKNTIPELMEKDGASNNWRYKIERYTATLNVGKRTQWSGELPFELLKSITEHEPFTKKQHILALELENLRQTLHHVHAMHIDLEKLGDVLYGEIDTPLNIQGWVCKKELQKQNDEKPTSVIIINVSQDPASGSIRVSDNNTWDAEAFLRKARLHINSIISGGHPRAAGFTIAKKDVEKLKQRLKTISFSW